MNAVIRASAQGYPRQYGAVFQLVAPPIDESEPTSSLPITDITGRSYQIQKSAMLSHNIRVVQGEEQVIPSLVWTEIFDKRLIGARKPLYRFATCVFSETELARAPADRKADTFFPALAVALGKDIGEKVQAAADAVDDSASFGIEDPRQRIPNFDLQNILAGPTIFLGDDDIWGVWTNPSSDPSLEDLELGFGPINCSLSV